MLHLRFGADNHRRSDSKRPDTIGLFAEDIIFAPKAWSGSVIRKV